jgi:tight adherence protein B
MTDAPFQLLDLLIIVAVFVLILSVWLGIVLFWSSRRVAKRKQVEQRLGILAGTDGESRVLHLWHDAGEATTLVPGAAQRYTTTQRITRAFHEAGMDAPLPVIFSGLALTMALVFGLAYLFLGHLVLSIICGIVPAMVFKMFVTSRIDRRAALFERQFVDAMQLAARSLRGGHPLMGAFQLVSEELPEPVSELFLEICQHHEMGASLEDSLAQAAAEASTPDVKLFAASVAIQVKSGGSLADMMERLSSVVRDRMRIVRKTRTLSAQTQLSKRILLILPVAMFLLLNLIASEYMDPFYTTFAGNVLLGLAAAGLLLGGWMMNWMSVVKY